MGLSDTGAKNYSDMGRSLSLKGTNTHHNVQMGQISQTEVMVEIYSKSLVRTIGKVLPMIFSYNTN